LNNNPLAARTDLISSFIAMDVLERAQELEAQGVDIIHMELGEPDLPTPEPIKEAALKLCTTTIPYTHSLGKIDFGKKLPVILE
jgi:aspartate/methionine/tyrosine aminotransferase